MAGSNNQHSRDHFVYDNGGIIRGDTLSKRISIVFTGDEFADGGRFITKTLASKNIKASFFFTGNFYRNPAFKALITSLKKDGHYLGAHSNKHLLYCDWQKRDSLLVTKDSLLNDITANYREMQKFGISKSQAQYFMPPYEWYNDSVSAWIREAGLQVINFTPGTLSNADYTTPDMKNYRSSDSIMKSIKVFEKQKPNGLNGFILLVHIGTDKKRTDKFYKQLPELLEYLQQKGYKAVRIDELLK
ncbi:MAG: polysaccharide deacetylase family protein [Agriterribacter sp.]